MKTSPSMTKDPICGMTVSEATAIHTERDGQTYYFCGDTCRKKFLSAPEKTAQNAQNAKNTKDAKKE